MAIILVGSFVAGSCSLVGTFLVLRKMALLGDAISHAVLPGIVAAFLLTRDLGPLPTLLGASAVGVLTVFLVETLSKSRRLHEDTSIGVVFPALFAIGVILVTVFADSVHLDAECVLYGEIAIVSQDLWIVAGKSLGPRALWITGGVLCFDLILVLCFFKELKISSFDPDLGASLGYSPVFLHYLLMTAVSVTVVASFESVGSILVVAMLVVPPATAYLLTDRLPLLLVLSVFVGVLSAVAGYGFARWQDCSIAGAMATAAGGFFVLALLCSPRHGWLSRWLGHLRLRDRLAAQLVLLHLKGRAGIDAGGTLAAADVERRFGWSHEATRRVLRRLTAAGLVACDGDGLRLTAAGEREIEAAGTGPLAHPH
jgi:manganese/zinc/iron transport system permease protein